MEGEDFDLDFIYADSEEEDANNTDDEVLDFIFGDNLVVVGKAADGTLIIESDLSVYETITFFDFDYLYYNSEVFKFFFYYSLVDHFYSGKVLRILNFFDFSIEFDDLFSNSYLTFRNIFVNDSFLDAFAFLLPYAMTFVDFLNINVNVAEDMDLYWVTGDINDLNFAVGSFLTTRILSPFSIYNVINLKYYFINRNLHCLEFPIEEEYDYESDYYFF